MLIAYILGKDRLWRKKRLYRKQAGVFMLRGFEYEIHPECVYNEKFLGIKLRQCIRYVNGVKKPLRFDDFGSHFEKQELPLDQIAYIAQNAMRQILMIIAVILSGITFVTVLIVALKVFEMIK